MSERNQQTNGDLGPHIVNTSWLKKSMTATANHTLLITSGPEIWMTATAKHTLLAKS